MATETLRPNAAGDETNITSCTGANWECVDEAVADDGISWVRVCDESSIAWYRDLYNLPASSGSGTINKITVYFRLVESDYSRYGKASIKTNATVYDGAQQGAKVSGQWVTYSEEWAQNPHETAAWTWDEIDALQIGVSIDSHYDGGYEDNIGGKCTQVYVEVDYTEALPQFGNSMVSKLIGARII